MFWNADFMNKGNPAWNAGFDKAVPDGAAGNQAQLGIFFDDYKGVIQRLTEAEGHERGFNPDTVERNPIGQEAKTTEIRAYSLSFDKDMIIKKGAPNYEHFASLARLRPTGDNAKMRIYLVDFRMSEKGDGHFRYYAEMMTTTVTINTINETDGTLSVNFTQDGDYTIGVMERTDSSISEDESTYTYGFTPSRLIAITGITTSVDEIKTEDDGAGNIVSKVVGKVEFPVGGGARVAVSFSPLGCPYDFSVKSADESKAVVTRWNQSIDIKGRAVGDTTVTVTSTADPTVTAEIKVTVI